VAIYFCNNFISKALNFLISQEVAVFLHRTF